MSLLIFVNDAVLQSKKVITFLPSSLRSRRVVFITTASNVCEDKSWVFDTQRVWRDEGFIVDPIDVSEVSTAHLQAAIAKCGCLFVIGGNSFFLLQEVRRSGSDKVIREAVTAGLPYIGESAGAILLGTSLDPIRFTGDPTITPGLKSLEGLGLVDFVPLVHFGHSEYAEKYVNLLPYLMQSKHRGVLIREDDFLVIDEGKMQFVTLKSE